MLRKPSIEYMQINHFKNGLLIALILILCGCSSASLNDLFNGYDQQMRGVKQSQLQGNFKQAINLIPPRSSNDSSYSLSMLEKARLEFLANKPEQSQQDFEQVYNVIQKSQQAAKFQLSRGVENFGAILSNDNVIRYDIPLYEQSMLHSYQAFNYLQQKDLSGALVEIRRANIVQQQALRDNLGSIYNVQNQLGDNSFYFDDVANRYPDMSNTIGKVKNGFQNAYTFFLSALLYEAAGQQNDAYIDYKKALEIYPENSYLQQDVMRLATSLHMTDDIAKYKARFAYASSTVDNEQNQGQIVIFAESGIVANKQEYSMNLPVYTSHDDMRFYSVALPSYQNQLKVFSPVELVYQNKHYQTEEIVRIQSLAAKSLEDQLPAIVTRQVSRLIAKEKFREQAQRQGGDLGNIFANIYNMSTEKADTRSWSTLPDSIQILRLNLASGEHQLELNVNGKSQVLNVSIQANKITLVKLTAIGSFTNYHTFNI